MRTVFTGWGALNWVRTTVFVTVGCGAAAVVHPVTPATATAIPAASFFTFHVSFP
jgi:hypothetical protein